MKPSPGALAFQISLCENLLFNSKSMTMTRQAELDRDLIASAFAGKAGEAMALLAQGANPLAASSSALRLAASEGSVECVKLLIPISNPMDEDSQALFEAAKGNFVECLALLIPVSNPKADGSRALFAAASRGHVESALLLMSVSDLSSDASRAFRGAAGRKMHTCCELLFPHVSPADMRGAMVQAAAAGNASTVALMLSHHPEAFSSLSFPAMIGEACERGHPQVAAIFAAFIERAALRALFADPATASSRPTQRL